MSVQRCHLCRQYPEEARLYGDAELQSGEGCPICYQPTCRYHLTTVRWRWRDGSGVDAARVCRECKRTYAHRDWDTLKRDWIT
ncbi:MAG: hypothetical protein R3272_13935 [Candidatus Promineifilaceae bacterium]|nr:hypothetical protein [Candidatus Promineifilaceae bacterium]